MCKPKNEGGMNEGGMSFRELQKFNKTLVAKP